MPHTTWLETLLKTRLGAYRAGQSAARMLTRALASADPATAVAKAIVRDGDVLRIGTREAPVCGRIFVIAIGKAAAPMTRGLLESVGRIDEGLVVDKHGGPIAALATTDHVTRIIAAHPVPDARSVEAGRAVLELAAKAGTEDIVFVLISGGASALATAPRAPITLDDLARLTNALLASGAPIEALNTARKHLDRCKGGGIGIAAAPARVFSLILSDVLGERLDVVASGPTTIDPSTWSDVDVVLRELRARDLPVPQAVEEMCRRGLAGDLPETPKAVEAGLDHVTNLLVASNASALETLALAARDEGWCVAGTSALDGEAREAATRLVELAKAQVVKPHTCWLAGGETTVRVTGTGLGGRNTELALAAVSALEHTDLVLVTLATDGEDGPTDAAGAIVDGSTLPRARALGLDPAEFLRRNDAYRFFEALGDLVRIGPTGTNVCDLALVFHRGRA